MFLLPARGAKQEPHATLPAWTLHQTSRIGNLHHACCCALAAFQIASSLHFCIPPGILTTIYRQRAKKVNQTASELARVLGYQTE